MQKIGVVVLKILLSIIALPFVYLFMFIMTHNACGGEMAALFAPLCP